jgi:hypothetical protein
MSADAERHLLALRHPKSGVLKLGRHPLCVRGNSSACIRCFRPELNANVFVWVAGKTPGLESVCELGVKCGPAIDVGGHEEVQRNS